MAKITYLWYVISPLLCVRCGIAVGDMSEVAAIASDPAYGKHVQTFDDLGDIFNKLKRVSLVALTFFFT